jgi:hypothetical protein
VSGLLGDHNVVELFLVLVLWYRGPHGVATHGCVLVPVEAADTGGLECLQHAGEREVAPRPVAPPAALLAFLSHTYGFLVSFL